MQRSSSWSGGGKQTDMPISFGVKGAGVTKKKAGGAKRVAATFLQGAKDQDEEEEAERTAQAAAAARLRDEGLALAEAGELAAALRKWDAAVALNPDDAKLHEMRSQAFLALEVSQHSLVVFLLLRALSRLLDRQICTCLWCDALCTRTGAVACDPSS
jgi:hypothetical protein